MPAPGRDSGVAANHRRVAIASRDKTHAHEYEQRAHRHGDRPLAKALGPTAMKTTHSSAGWIYHLGGLFWSVGVPQFIDALIRAVVRTS